MAGTDVTVKLKGASDSLQRFNSFFWRSAEAEKIEHNLIEVFVREWET